MVVWLLEYAQVDNADVDLEAGDAIWNFEGEEQGLITCEVVADVTGTVLLAEDFGLNVSAEGDITVGDPVL